MGRIIIVVVLGVALFGLGIWLFPELLPFGSVGKPVTDSSHVTSEDKLGAFLYKEEKFPKVQATPRRPVDQVVLSGVLNPMDQEEVPSEIQGRILFIGEELDPDVAALAGSAALIPEPYYFATVYAGGETFVKFYRQLYEGQVVRKDQGLGMINPAEAMGVVLEKMAKIDAARAEKDAAEYSEKEGYTRWQTNLKLFPKAVGAEELRGSELTYLKFKYERVSKEQAVKLAENEKNTADIKMYQHRIRALIPFENSIIKSIVRQRGYMSKPMDPVVMVVQNLDRLLAEAQIEQSYFERLKTQKKFTATIEPTLLEAPLHEFLGHVRDVTSVAVSRDMKIVSGSEDLTVRVWSPAQEGPVRKWDHATAVKVVACAPAGSEKNLCIAGCQDGSIYLWDLDGTGNEPVVKIEPEAAHGRDTSITSVAFSPGKGEWFATGALDGSIKLWSTADGKEKYLFDAIHGVENGHEDAVTALHFTPQCRLVSAGRDKTLRVWKLKQDGAVLDGKAIAFRAGDVPNLGVSNDGKWMLFDTGRTLQLQSLESRNTVHTISTPVDATPFGTLALFSPDGTMILTAGAAEGRLQLWSAPTEKTRGFEVRQLAAKSRTPVSCAAFSPSTQQPFAVSASGQSIYMWSLPTAKEISEHRIENVPLTLKNSDVNPTTNQIRIGFEVKNKVSERYPEGRFEAGRPVTIVIDQDRFEK